MDQSNGYETIFKNFMSVRSRSNIGVATVRDWTASLSPSGAVLDVGCGHGVPISESPIDQGFTVYGIDALPNMIAAFRFIFTNTLTECCAIEDSQFFERRFDGVIAWGLMFLLAPDVQANLIHKIALALRPGGRFLFTAPRQACGWPDNLTMQKSVSLGSDAYRKIIDSEGLTLVGETEDERQNHCYWVFKPSNVANKRRHGTR